MNELRSTGRPEPGSPALQTLLVQLREDHLVNGSSISRPGFRAIAVHRVGTYGVSLPNPLARRILARIHRVAHHWVRNRYGIELPPTTVVGRRCFIAHQHGIVVHPDARIGDDCKIRHGVTIGQLSGQGSRPGAPVIGDRVEIGVGAVIVGPVTIGDDAVIGPNAVVLRDVPAGAVASGPPAKVVLAAVREGP